MIVHERLRVVRDLASRFAGHVGIAVLKGHVAILFRRTTTSGDELQLLHLGYHHWVVCNQVKPKFSWLDVDVEPERQVLMAQLCELLEKEYVTNPEETRQLIGYAFRYDPTDHFDPTTGKLIMKEGNGLTCATFVLAAFASHGIFLLDETSWKSRATDTEWQKDVVTSMRSGKVAEEHIERVEKEIGCFRFRPEEVAAAGTVNAAQLPLGFRDAEARGLEIVEELLKRAGTTH